jgi:pSer/pThr/pTyr-binding forkhead associated (FHA) protein
VPPTFSANWSLADGTGRTVRLPAGNGAATVGRQPSNDLVLSDAAVSSNHARLNVDGGVLTVVDLNSTNGTFVNGQRLTPQVPAPLRTGDRVKFAALEFVVQSG